MYTVIANGKKKSFFTYNKATAFAKQLREAGVKPVLKGGLFSETPDATILETVTNASTVGYARLVKAIKAIPQLRVIVKPSK